MLGRTETEGGDLFLQTGPTEREDCDSEVPRNDSETLWRAGDQSA